MCIRNSEVNNKQMVRINQKHSEFRSSFRRQHAGYIQERRPLFHTSTKLTGENAAEKLSDVWWSSAGTRKLQLIIEEINITEQIIGVCTGPITEAN
jgi:hypothetical protein